MQEDKNFYKSEGIAYICMLAGIMKQKRNDYTIVFGQQKRFLLKLL